MSRQGSGTLKMTIGIQQNFYIRNLNLPDTNNCN